jgi:hypothetical protein
MVYHGLKIARNPWPGRLLFVLNDSSWHAEQPLIDKKVSLRFHSEEKEIEPPHQEKRAFDGIVTDLLWCG